MLTDQKEMNTISCYFQKTRKVTATTDALGNVIIEKNRGEYQTKPDKADDKDKTSKGKEGIEITNVEIVIIDDENEHQHQHHGDVEEAEMNACRKISSFAGGQSNQRNQRGTSTTEDTATVQSEVSPPTPPLPQVNYKTGDEFVSNTDRNFGGREAKNGAKTTFINQQVEETMENPNNNCNQFQLLKNNPFAKFAYHQKAEGQQKDSLCSSSSRSSLSRSKIRTKRPVPVSNCSKRQQKRTRINNKERTQKRHKVEGMENVDLNFNEISPNEEKQKFLKKWHSFADHDAPLETRRFQVLVACRLHCQAHESVVRSAFASLKKFITSPPPTNENGDSKNCSFGVTHQQEEHKKRKQNNRKVSFLDVETLSAADPCEIAKVISSVLFANVKAKQIVQAAAEIKSQFGGAVPESEHSLKMISGIGPKLAQVLHHVNCRKHYRISDMQ